jgi:hypothetical protein
MVLLWKPASVELPLRAGAIAPTGRKEGSLEIGRWYETSVSTGESQYSSWLVAPADIGPFGYGES